jgi:hypothetical protein
MCSMQALSRSAALWLQAGRPAAAIEALETLERSCKLKPGERQELTTRLARCAGNSDAVQNGALGLHSICQKGPRPRRLSPKTLLESGQLSITDAAGAKGKVAFHGLKT